MVKCHWWYLVLGVTVLQTQCIRCGLESGQNWQLGQFLWCQLCGRWRHRSGAVSDGKVGIIKTLAFLWRGWRWCREMYVNFCRTTLFVCNICFWVLSNIFTLVLAGTKHNPMIRVEVYVVLWLMTLSIIIPISAPYSKLETGWERNKNIVT